MFRGATDREVKFECTGISLCKVALEYLAYRGCRYIEQRLPSAERIEYFVNA